jgi:GxxExxY protein
MTELVLKQEVYEIVGAALEVYYRLGRGFLEPVYQEAMEIEFHHRRIPFEAKKELFIRYKEYTLKKTYEPDFVCFNQIIVEIKALDRLSGKEESQLLNYMRANSSRVGVLVNFGSSIRLEWKRYVL